VNCARKVELQRRIKQAGGKWNLARRLQEMGRDQALKLGLKDCFVPVEGTIDLRKSN
jgi:hypothetical protein